MTSAAPIEPTPTGRQPFEVRDPISVRQLAAVVGISLAVVIATSIIASNGEVATWEAGALRFFNDWPDWLEPIMWTLQQVGVLAGPLIGGVVIAVVARRWEYVIPFALLMPLKLILEKAVLKQLIERERPYVTIGPDITVRGPAFEGLSFPSGHTTTAFAFAILVAAFLPRRWRPLPVVWAAVVGIARLYMGEHNVLDVIAGAAVGTIFASVLWFTVLNRFVAPAAEAQT